MEFVSPLTSPVHRKLRDSFDNLLDSSEDATGQEVSEDADESICVAWEGSQEERKVWRRTSREILNRAPPASCDVGTQTEGTGGITRLTMELVLDCSADDGSVVGAEIKYVPAGVQLGVPWGVRTAHGVFPSLE